MNVNATSLGGGQGENSPVKMLLLTLVYNEQDVGKTCVMSWTWNIRDRTRPPQTVFHFLACDPEAGSSICAALGEITELGGLVAIVDWRLGAGVMNAMHLRSLASLALYKVNVLLFR